MTSMTKSQKEKGLIALAVLFLLVLTAYSYFSVFKPAHDARKQAEQILSSEREVLMALQTQLKELPEGEKISARDLQQKVSVEPLAELLVLQIEQAELLSNTLITNIIERTEHQPEYGKKHGIGYEHKNPLHLLDF